MNMKVKNLIAKLKLLDPEAKVILSSDGEGNGYFPIEQVWVDRDGDVDKAGTVILYPRG